MKDFFISYNKADSSWAEWIAWELEEAGYSVVIQAWDFRPGSNFVVEMNEALKAAERMIAVLSPEYVASHFTAPEWATVFARDSIGSDRKLVPVRVREVDLSGLLGQIVYVDFVGVADEAASRKLLLDGVQRGRAKPKRKPVFPGSLGRVMNERPRFPETQPTIWNVPHSRNRNFTGRTELLATLSSQLHEGHYSALTALHGLGGIGKTQTALEYTFRNASEYELVWWIRSEDPTTLASDYARLAAALDLSESGTDQRSAIQAVKDRLATTSRWLLVFDNARNWKEIKPYLPVGGNGHVIITSRDPDWRTIAAPLPVGTLSADDAIEFLRRRTGQHDEHAARELAEELGRLPLAIEQAAAYIDEKSKPLAEYLSLFRKHQQQLLRRGQPPAYPDTIETTWELSFKEIEERFPAGAALLNLCAFVAPDDIPIEVIRGGSDMIVEPLASAAADELELEEAVSALRRYSLVERSQDALSVHRLVQAMVRDRMTKSDRQTWAVSAAGVIRKAFPFNSDEASTWSTCIRLLPHATTVVGHCEAEGIAPIFVSSLLSQSALYLQARADFTRAKILNERALEITEAIFGPDHPRVATRLNNLGGVLHDLGLLNEAREHFERALEIDEATYGPDHPEVAIDLNNLGSALRGLGKLEEAVKHFETALMIDSEAYGLNHPSVVTRLNNLGGVLHELGRLDEARKHFQRALKIVATANGMDQMYIAMTMNNLGAVLHDLGEAEEAQKHIEQALKIVEASHGPEHPYVGACFNNLASVLRTLGQFKEAREHYEQALKINETSYGPNHLEVAITINNLGLVLQAMGKPAEAREHFERALKIIETKLGVDHQSFGTVASNLRMLGFPKSEAEAWDHQIEADVAAGRLDDLADEALSELRAGRTRPL